ncbi:hypothetical protein EYF80_048286 [Liparis tanakae]|uniref:Uncharacterized protein n=1 Tax=Liparis tanakae TaxID=230148 RepID=A0A4Z2FKV1_9TELE|nr:hypothetical protein EYF80_048286 [Liparis tanakae]
MKFLVSTLLVVVVVVVVLFKSHGSFSAFTDISLRAISRRRFDRYGGRNCVRFKCRTIANTVFRANDGIHVQQLLQILLVSPN